MKNFKNIILGITTGLLIFPLVDKIFEISILWLETLKTKPTKRILKGNVEMKPMEEFLEPVNQIYDEYEDDDE